MFYSYGNINISDEAKETGQLSYRPITIDTITGQGYQVGGLPGNWEQLLQEKIKDIIARIIKPGMSDVEKEYAIFNYIQNNTVYGLSPNAGNAYGCLIEGVSVCQGDVEGTKKLLDAAGIENQIAYGQKGDGTRSGPHAWNIVKIGNEYFHLDALQNRFNMNDADAKSEYYVWQEGSIPVCSSRFSIPQGLSFFAYNGYIYYTSGDNHYFYFDINRCKPDGSENTKLFTTQNGGSYIFQENGWLYYFEYEGSKVYRVRTDGSEETLVHSFGSNARIHDGDISDNALYLVVQTDVSGAYKKSIMRIDMGSLNVTTIVTFGEDMNMWNAGDNFYYYRKSEDRKVYFYRMTLDGSVETMIQKL